MKILFVCLGNICRSPMAEGIFRDKAKAMKMDIEFDSCGTGDWHVGEAPDHRAQKCIKEMGSDISDLRGRQFHPSDFKTFDRIYTMDENNHKDILALASNKQEQEKVSMVLDSIYPDKHMSVPDPYLGSRDGFMKVYDMLDAAAERILSEIEA